MSFQVGKCSHSFAPHFISAKGGRFMGKTVRNLNTQAEGSKLSKVNLFLSRYISATILLSLGCGIYEGVKVGLYTGDSDRALIKVQMASWDTAAFLLGLPITLPIHIAAYLGSKSRD